jgi:hypothetical protein
LWSAQVSSPTAIALLVSPLVSIPVKVPKLITSPLTPLEIFAVAIPITVSSELIPPTAAKGSTSILPLDSAPEAETKVPFNIVDPVLFLTK